MGSGRNASDGDCRGVLTFTAVPFVMAIQRTAEGDQAFLEHVSRHVAWLFWTFATIGAVGSIPCVLMVYPAIVDPTVPFPWTIAAAGLFEISLTVLMVAFAIRAQSTARRLVFFNKSLRLAIQVVRSNGRVEREWVEGIDRCRLTMHPVELIDPTGITFSGWMARVMVGDRGFVLACCKGKEEVLAYMQGLPAWLLAISTGEGEKVVGQLSDRRFGSKAIRI